MVATPASGLRFRVFVSMFSSSPHTTEYSMALQGRLHNEESASELSEEEEEEETRLVDLRGISSRVSHHSEEKIHPCQFCDKVKRLF